MRNPSQLHLRCQDLLLFFCMRTREVLQKSILAGNNLTLSRQLPCTNSLSGSRSALDSSRRVEILRGTLTWEGPTARFHR